MKFRLFITVMLATFFLLVACSGPKENQGSLSNFTEEPAENVVMNEEKTSEFGLATEQELELENKEEPTLSFDPTPSPLFEQNYGPNEVSERDYSDLEIITLLPQDAIRAIDNPEYYSVREANQEYAPDELVIGVEFNGDARAYSVSLLSRHEIVNDTVGGVKIAVTW